MQIQSFLPPREISLMAGASGAGKSTFVLQLVQSWLDKTNSFDLPTPVDATYGYIKADRTISDLESVASRIGFDLSRIHIVDLVNSRRYNPKHLSSNATGLFEDILRDLKRKQVTHVIVDPLSVFIGEDLNRYHKVATKLILMNRFCIDHDLTILGTHHTTKARSDFHFLRPQDSISGSSALQGYTSTQFNLAASEEIQDADEPTSTRLFIISHTAAPETLWLERDDKGCFHKASTHIAKAGNELGADGISIMKLFRNGEELAADTLVKALGERGASRATAYRRLKALEDKGLLVRSARGKYTRPDKTTLH